jgi:hypothetical protein
MKHASAKPLRGKRGVALTLLLAALAFRTAPAHAATLGYGASAYGTYAFGGSAALLGKTAPVALGCGTRAGASKTSTLASVTDAPLATTGATDTEVSTTTTSAKAMATVEDVILLGGVITATEVQAVSVTSQDAHGLHVSGAASHFLGLVVQGVAITNVAANTTIPLAGLGKVVLNEQGPVIGASYARLTVNMIHVYVTVANHLGIATGTQLIVGDAFSGLAVANGPGLLYGYSYGTSISGSSVQSGATAPASLPCLGTNGQTVTNTSAGLNGSGQLKTGTITDTATGNITPSLVSGQTTANVNALNLLGGVVTAGSVKVVVNVASSDGVHVTRTDTGTAFGHLVVQGHPEINDSTPPNTTVALAGIGKLYVRRQIVGANSIEERGLELVIAPSNGLGLPTMDIIMGRAAAAILKP